MYLPALTFGAWSYDGHGGKGTFTAQIESQDPFRMAQRPLTIVVAAGRAEWRWTIDTLSIAGSTLTASVVRV